MAVGVRALLAAAPTMTIVAVDVAYEDDTARAAGVRFATFDAAEPLETATVEVTGVAPYVPGSLYLRELPALRAVLARFDGAIDVVIVDTAWRLAIDDIGHRSVQKKARCVGGCHSFE